MKNANKILRDAEERLGLKCLLEEREGAEEAD